MHTNMETNGRLNRRPLSPERHHPAINQTVPAQAPSASNDDVNGGPAVKRNWTGFVVEILKEQWFLITLGILIAITSQVQVPLDQQELKRTVASYVCISLIFFTTGCILDTKTLLQNYGRWKVNLFVQAQCFLMTSIIVFGLVSAVATSRFMDPGLLVGFIFLSCVATTISSNVVMTRQAHGNTALTVVQTTIGNLLGVFITPALVVGYTAVPTWYNTVLPPSSGRFQEIYRRVLMQLGLSIYLPLVVGQIVRNLFPKACKKVFIDWNFNKLGSVCLLVLLWSTYDQAFASHAFENVPASNSVFIVFISVGLWIVYFGIAFLTSRIWLPREDVVAICYCVPAKGIVMGYPLSATIWSGLSLELESKILIPIVIYQGLQLAFGSVLIHVFRRWVAHQENQEHGMREQQEDQRIAQNSIEDKA